MKRSRFGKSSASFVSTLLTYSTGWMFRNSSKFHRFSCVAMSEGCNDRIWLPLAGLVVGRLRRFRYDWSWMMVMTPGTSQFSVKGNANFGTLEKRSNLSEHGSFELLCLCLKSRRFNHLAKLEKATKKSHIVVKILPVIFHPPADDIYDSVKPIKKECG